MFWPMILCRFRNGARKGRDICTGLVLQTAKPFSELPKIPAVPLLNAGWAYLPYIGKYKITAMHHANEKKYRQYGPVFREKLTKELDFVHIFDPEDFQKIYRNEGRMPERKFLFSLLKYREERLDLYQNVGIFFSNGDDWYKVRSNVQPHMMKPKAIHTYLKVMDEVALEQVDRTVLHRKENGGEVKNYLSELYNWALESVGVVALDTRLGCLNLKPNEEGTEMIKLVNDVFEQALVLEFDPLQKWKYFKTPLWKRFSKNMDEFSEIVIKYLVLARKRLETLPEDHEATFLELLISTAKDPRHITTLIIDMFFAGIDTTSTTVGMTLYHLARNPKAQERAYQEIKRALQSRGMTPEAINNIRYLKACVKESMRISPVVLGVGRTVMEDIEVQGYHIPKGTMFMLNNYVTSRLEKYFPDPLVFRPERFLREETTHDPFAFLPFGFGPRSCVGRRIAEQEIWTLLMRLLERFRVEYHHGEIDYVTRLLNVPNKPLDFEFYDR